MEILYMLVLTSVTEYIEASIAGVTYMDNFDFEERYRNVNECNPIYYHPLHLPEECIDMYEELIRSKIGSLGPFQVFKDRLFDNVQEVVTKRYEYRVENPEFLLPVRLSRPPIKTYISQRRQLSPLQRMLEMVRADAMKIPIAPEIGIAPQYGPVAVYYQPISIKSEKAIKEISGAYLKAMTPHKSMKN